MQQYHISPYAAPLPSPLLAQCFRGGRSAAILGGYFCLLYRQNYLSGRRQAVPSPVHCRGTDMAWLTRDQKLEITRLHGADDHANVDASLLQYGNADAEDKVMIYSDRQYSISRAELTKLKAALDSSKRSVSTSQPWLQEIESNALKSQIAEIEAEIAEYDLLKRGQITVAEACVKRATTRPSASENRKGSKPDRFGRAPRYEASTGSAI